MKIETHPATLADATAVRNVAIESFTTAYAMYNTEENMRVYLSENFSEDRIKAEISAGEILAGISGEQLVAYAKLVQPEKDKIRGQHPLEIARFYTRPQMIGQGIGAEMIDAIAAIAVSSGHDSVCLDVWQKNFRAINFYQRVGFRICGLTQFHLGDDVQDDFVMIRHLK